MPLFRFHEAARDGILPILVEATEKDCNSGDDAGMTPVHWAAFCGHLPALRLLIGLGGKPSKYDSSGNTGLHHAAAGGHVKVVAFLVALGEDPWALNAEFQNPKVVAARHGREDVLRYLDAFMGRQMASNRKKALIKEEKAKKRAMARFPSAEVQSAPSSRRSSVATLVGSTTSIFRRRDSIMSKEEDAVLEESRGKQLWDKLRNAKSPVYRKMRRRREEEARALRRGDSADPRLEESSVYYGSSTNMSDIQRSVSQPDISSLYSRRPSVISSEGSIALIDIDLEDEVFTSLSMFERPGFGRIAFRAMAKPIFNDFQKKRRANSVGVFGSKEERQNEEELSPLDAFLAAWGLEMEGPSLHRAGFNLESLMNAKEEEFKHAGILLGPRKKLMDAIERRKAVIRSPSIIVSRL